ncbi:MAG: hypothetical protein F4Y44_08555 [Chloroflexi bacterium]|nr:hypothetical protein [Chloroflexota bacterium]
MLELVERHSTSKARLRRLLDEIAAEGWCERTLYLTPASYKARIQDRRIVRSKMQDDDVMGVVAQAVGESDTGLALFIGDGRAVAVCPPFPFADGVSRSGFVASPLLGLLDREYVTGVVLLRLGRYAVGVVRGNKLISSKTAGRYMKNRHRAGGQSQRRFERSRERLIRELYDKTCEIASAVFEPYVDTIDHILLGGENSTLTGFTDRCRLMQNISDKTLTRRLIIDRPDQKTLNNIAFEVWKSRVYSFQSVPESVETASLPTER